MNDAAGRNGVDISSVASLDGGDYYQLRSQYGLIDSIYSSDGIYQIANFDVWRPRQGHGRELLIASHEHARRLGAQSMLAIITSREAYESSRRVFDNEALIIQSLGGYSADQSEAPSATSVLLRGRLPLLLNN